MKDKVVVITGASSGIGRALAFEFGARGARLMLAARSSEALSEVAGLLGQKGCTVKVQVTDVSIEADCKALVDKTIKHFGRVDVFINNAGISMRALFSDMHLDVMRTLMDTNFYGTVYCTKYALPHLLESRGSLVGVISIAGFIGLPGRSAYSASKFAIRGLLNTIRVENSKKGLHVLVVAPGFTASEIRKRALLADGTSQGDTPRDESSMMSAEAVARRIFKAVVRRRRQLILTFLEGKLTVFLAKFVPSLVDTMSYRTMAKEPDSPFN